MKKVFLFIVSAFFLIIGIVIIIQDSKPKEYNYPVYISEKLTASGYANNITIHGKLKNRSDKNVEVVFLLRVFSGRDTYADIDKNIIIYANSEYDLFGEYMATGNNDTYYDRAKIFSCKINGESVILEYLTNDSQTTIKNDNFVPKFIIMCLFSVGFFIGALKTQY